MNVSEPQSYNEDGDSSNHKNAWGGKEIQSWGALRRCPPTLEHSVIISDPWSATNRFGGNENEAKIWRKSGDHCYILDTTVYTFHYIYTLYYTLYTRYPVDRTYILDTTRDHCYMLDTTVYSTHYIYTLYNTLYSGYHLG